MTNVDPPNQPPGPPEGPPPWQPVSGSIPRQVDVPIGPAPSPPSGGRRGLLLGAGILVGAVLGAGAIVAVTQLGGDEAMTTSSVSSTTTTTETSQSTTTETTVASTAPTTVDIEDLTAATVLVLAVDVSGEELWGGSGSIITPEGLILTNAHVVEQLPGFEYERLFIAVTTDAGVEPQPTYQATVVAFDPALDLAAVQIDADADGAPIEVNDLPTATIGDSDTVELGDSIRVLGYPSIGGDTITFTQGSVSGFTSESGLGDRAWIKTDATIAGGNSGGLAVNEAGELIGIPTRASAGANSPISDCRLVEDTNGDNVIDENDTCIPIGGFINGIRPVNLAAAVIEQGRAGEPVDPSVGIVDLDNVVDAQFAPPIFSSGVSTDDEPLDEVDQLPAGASQVCGFWDYSGMVDGVTWDALWFVDGEFSESISLVQQDWYGGESGNWWVCAFVDDADSLPTGSYELVLFVEDDALTSNTIAIGDQPRVEITFSNDSGVVVCYLLVSPSSAQNWGPDELDITETLDPGGVAVLDLPAGVYDILAQDCGPDPVSEQYGVDLTADTVVSLN